MTTTEHPLTEARAAELWDAHKAETTVSWAEMKRSPANACASRLSVMRAAFDAGREHEREHAPARPAEVTDEMVEAAAEVAFGTYGVRLRDAIAAALAVATPTDPHHDPRPWQDCTREDIRKGDLVEARAWDILYVGVAQHQGGDGNWFTEGRWRLTYGDRWPLRRIPAPAPLAEEVELPTGFGAVITDVEADLGETVRLDRMVWTGRRWAYEYYSSTAGFITAFTLPDGTRARRDGERADGTPRFVKVQEGDA